MNSSKPQRVTPAWYQTRMVGGALLLATTMVISGCPSSSTPTTPSSPSSSSSPPPSSPSSSSGMPSPSSPPSGAESMPTPSSGSPSPASSPSPSGSSSPADPSSAGAPSSDAGAETADAGSETDDGMETGGGDPAEVVFEDGPPPTSSPSDVMPDLDDEEVEESSSSTADADSESESSGGGPSGGGPEGGGEAGGGQPGGGPVLTTAEQVAVLDGELARGTGEFDDMILRERDYVRRTATNSTDSIEDEPESAGGGGYPGSVYGEPGAASSNDSGTGGFPGGSRQGDYGQTAAAYPPPADIPEGNDDDVVARQLREAAMREPDPELREKLWDEYRKYKGIKP